MTLLADIHLSLSVAHSMGLLFIDFNFISSIVMEAWACVSAVLRTYG